MQIFRNYFERQIKIHKHSKYRITITHNVSHMIFYQILTIITISTFVMRITYYNISKILYYKFHLEFLFDAIISKIDR